MSQSIKIHNPIRELLSAPPRPEGPIPVSDLGLAAALYQSGFLPESTRQEGGRIVWLYADTPFVNECIRDYRSGALKLSARTYNRALREFQQELRDMRFTGGR